MHLYHSWVCMFIISTFYIIICLRYMAQRRAGYVGTNYTQPLLWRMRLSLAPHLYPVAHSVTPPRAHHNKAGRYNINIYFQNTLVVRRVAIKHKRCLFNFKIIKYIFSCAVMVKRCCFSWVHDVARMGRHGSICVNKYHLPDIRNFVCAQAKLMSFLWASHNSLLICKWKGT